MWTKEKYCAVCGCPFSIPDTRDPVHPEPNEDPSLVLGNPYDSRFLPQQQTQWLTDFRVIGRWSEIGPDILNAISTPNLFLSWPAEWWYGWGTGEPRIPTRTGTTNDPYVFEPLQNDDDMLFPIHKACLDIMGHMCQIRQAQSQDIDVSKPGSLIAFCDALRQQRMSNIEEAEVPFSRSRHYARSGGLEWPHKYYGAQQFWTDEWDTEPGWELLCANPSPRKIPGIDSYLRVVLVDCVSTGTPNLMARKDIADRLGWLLPEELDALTETELGSVDWDKAIPVLLQMAHDNGPQAGDEEERREGKLRPTSAPLGLQNRWRIWKILQDV